MNALTFHRQVNVDFNNKQMDFRSMEYYLPEFSITVGRALPFSCIGWEILDHLRGYRKFVL